MIQLERVNLHEIRLPLREPFRISSGVAHERRICLLELVDRSGVTSWSECVARVRPDYTSETVDICWFSLQEWILPRVLGRSFDSAAEVFPAVHDGLRGHFMAKAAVEMGMWNLEARRRDLPLADLLGGEREQVPTGISLGIEEDRSELLRKVKSAVASGYRKIKLKIAPGSDVRVVAAVRAEIDPEVPLAVDGNAAYTGSDREHLTRLDRFDLSMIEQPLGPDDVVQHAALQRSLETPVCLDETVTGPDRAAEALEIGSCRTINIKPGRVGGLRRSIEIHDLCAAADVPVWCGGMLETGIGRSYNVALASLPNFTLPGDLSPSRRYWERDVVEPEWTMDERGFVQVPRQNSGLGRRVDRERIGELTVRSASITA